MSDEDPKITFPESTERKSDDIEVNLLPINKTLKRLLKRQ